MASPPEADRGTQTRRPSEDVARGRMSRIDRRWWIALIVVVVGSFAVLGFMGIKIEPGEAPHPRHASSTSGETVMTGDDIINGQQIWQSLGGQEIGSVWGHGAYVAPDWTADWLHREATWPPRHLGQGRAGADVRGSSPPSSRARCRRASSRLLRSNTYDPATGTGHPARPIAWRPTRPTRLLRRRCSPRAHDKYAIPKGTLTDAGAGEARWPTSSGGPAGPPRRPPPGSEVTYTQNWPHEPLIDNVPPADNILWSMVSLRPAARRHRRRWSSTTPRQ
jgi:nitric oxide reductase subunit B